MPHVLHTIWLDSHEPTNKDTLWIKPLKEGHYGAYVFGADGWVLISAISESIIEDLQSDWAENSPTSPFYIRNRTHWVEHQAGSQGGEIVHKLDNKFLNIDSEPIEGSDNPISSDAVAQALKNAVDKSIDDLENYYLKSETYNKTEIDNIIQGIEQFHYEVYMSLPQTGKGNTLYYIGPKGSGADRYEEYIFNEGAFVKIGETSVDLSGYVTSQDLSNILNDYVTNLQLTNALSTKQDTLTFDNVPTSGSNNPVKSGGVYNALLEKEDKMLLKTTVPQTGMLPNHFYEYGDITDTSYTFVMDTTNVDNSLANIWTWGFNTLSIATEIIWPVAITSWYNGIVPNITAGNRYEVSVVNGLGICVATTSISQ